MREPHLRARVTPFLDGRLSADAEARAQVHLESCHPCRDDVADERSVIARLRDLPAPQAGDDLLIRLLDIGGPVGPLPPRDRPMARPARPAVGLAPPRSHAPVRPLPRSRRRARRPLAVALAGSFGLLGAGVAGLIWLGPQHAPPVAELRPSPTGLTTATATP